MRIRSLSATALAAAALLQPLGVFAQLPQHDVVYHAANVVQAAATSVTATTSTVTTFTLTRTVMRVVATATATRLANVKALTTAVPTNPASASLTLMPYANGTASVLGTGASPSLLSTQSATPSGAASRVGMDTVGWAAMVGLVGLVAM
ncbi:hypothetical protein LTR08_004645 [Meristemomyces frigidus]|nr:hypothetical protein LTR08_004645 [Meristemomyces frigidus]